MWITDIGAGQALYFVTSGDSISFKDITLDGSERAIFRVRDRTGAGGNFEVHADSPNGALLGTATLVPTAGMQKWMDLDVPLIDPGGTHELFLVFRHDHQTSRVIYLNWIRFLARESR